MLDLAMFKSLMVKAGIVGDRLMVNPRRFYARRLSVFMATAILGGIILLSGLFSGVVPDLQKNSSIKHGSLKVGSLNPQAAFTIDRAHAQDSSTSTKARFGFVLDVKTGSVFLNKNADVPMAPASMSKLMTVAVIFNELKTGRLKLDDAVRISVNAWRNGGAPSGTSAMFAPVKSEISVEQAIRGIIIQSGNDAAMAIAEHIGGTEQKFAEMMEAYGKKIGLKHSTFRNATGLPHPEHLMSARDLGMLALHLMTEFPEYYHYFSEKRFKYRRFNFYNRNPLIRLDKGYDGLKTGYTKASKYGIVVSARRNWRRMIVVLNGLESKKDRTEEAQRVTSWAYEQFVQKEILPSTQKFAVRVWGGEKSWVPLSTAGPLKIYVPKDEAAPEIISEIIYEGPLKAPVIQGQRAAILRVKIGESVQEHDLYADETIDRTNFVYRALDSLFYLTFGWIL
ncbi:MAG: D-alanyl-D-alanine carboxypeptidase [Rhodomicrobium sp.]|nr:MAG: D-alanyl-D-alanine carboxypeptidase [Rhodomicrobium sp.]